MSGIGSGIWSRMRRIARWAMGGAIWPARREQDLDAEIRAHMEMAVQERMAGGEAREEAERAVRREFGNEARVKEVTRTQWQGVLGGWWDRLGQDLRFGVRSLRRAPTFAILAILTLALGIGVTTAMFTVVNGVLLRPLPFDEPERLVALNIGEPSASGAFQILTQDAPAVRELPAFASVGTHLNYPPVTLTGAGDPARLNAAFVSAGLHRMLGVAPAVGNGFAPGHDAEGAGRVVVLGNALWQSRFGADPEVVGRSVTIDGLPYSVVGVMPPGFSYPEGADLWLPTSASPFTVDNYGINAVARLADGVSIERARTELAALSVQLQGFSDAVRSPDVPSDVRPLQDVLVGDARAPLLLFLGAVALVLLISCTNVANLLLMRSNVRAREIGLRKALGAAGPRVMRQLLTESVLLGLAGGMAGVLLAIGGLRWLLTLAPPGTLPRGDEVGVDTTVLLFVVAVSILTGVVFGLVPALRSARREETGLLVEGSRTQTHGRGLARGLLVTVEVSLAVTLLVGAGLLLRSFQELRAVDLGFQPERTLTLEIDLPERVYDDVGLLEDLHGRILDGFREIPGVTAAGASNIEPFGPLVRHSSILIDGLPPIERGFNAFPIFSTATPGYLRSMGMRLLEGRDFTEEDADGASDVALINRTMAQRYWPEESPIGERFSRRPNPEPGDWKTIVGVVDDVVIRDVAGGPESREPMFWIPMAQAPANDAYILAHVEYVVRTAGEEGAIAAAMRAVVRDVDPNLPTGTIASIDAAVLDTMGERLFQTRLLTVFAVLALVLAGVGIFGVTAFNVTERFHEIGIRMALGAEAGRVAGAVVGGASLLILPGLAVGASMGAAVGRVLSASLFEVTPLDPVTIATVCLLLGAVATVSTAIPARRAARIDPSSLLRME